MPQWVSSPTLNRAELNRQHQVHGLIYRHISNYTAVFSEAIHQLQKMSNLQKLPVTFDTVNTWGKECFYRPELARKVTIQIKEKIFTFESIYLKWYAHHNTNTTQRPLWTTMPQPAWWGEHVNNVHRSCCELVLSKPPKLSPDFPLRSTAQSFKTTDHSQRPICGRSSEPPQTNQTASSQRLTNRADAPNYCSCLKRKN